MRLINLAVAVAMLATPAFAVGMRDRIVTAHDRAVLADVKKDKRISACLGNSPDELVIQTAYFYMPKYHTHNLAKVLRSLGDCREIPD
jgi:hypothetical protein